MARTSCCRPSGNGWNRSVAESWPSTTSFPTIATAVRFIAARTRRVVPARHVRGRPVPDVQRPQKPGSRPRLYPRRALDVTVEVGIQGQIDRGAAGVVPEAKLFVSRGRTT